MNRGRARVAVPLLMGLALLLAAFLVRNRFAPSALPPVPRPSPQATASPSASPATPPETPRGGTLVLKGSVVRAHSGEPIAGALLLLRGPRTAVKVEADERGRFRFPPLPRNEYSLVGALHECGWHSPPRPLVLDSDPVPEITLELASVWSLSGRVITLDGTVPTSIRLRARHSQGGPDLVQTLRGADFHILVDPSHDQVFLSAESEGYAPSETLAVPRGATEDISGLKLRLGHGTPVTGVVFDESGRPLEKVRVELRSQSHPESPPRRVPSDPSGGFSFPGVLPGTYSVKATHPGLIPAEIEGLVVASEAPTTPVTLRMGKGWTIRGRLSDSTGKAIAHGTVRVREGAQTTQGQTGEDGRFEIGGIEPATGEANRFPNIDKVQGSAPGFGPVTLLDVPPESDVQITLLAAGTLTLRVQGSEGPLAPDLRWTARLLLRQAENPQDKSADQDNRATQCQGPSAKIENLAPGAYDLEVSAPGRSTLRQEGVRIASGQATTRDLVLLPGKSDTPIIDFEASTPEDMKAKLPKLLDGYTEEARESLITVLRGLYPTGSPERQALEEVVLGLRAKK